MIRVLVRDAVLDENESHHLSVRRAAPGELVEVRDGEGMVGRARLARSGRTWSVEIEEATTLPPPRPLVVAVGSGDRDRFGWLVEKAAELGVTAVVPLRTEHTAGVASKLREEQLDRLRRRAREAIKQSGAAWAPRIEGALSLDDFIARPFTGHRWLADPDGETPSAVLDDAPIVVAVGPEGGFAEGERARLIAGGFMPTALGAHTLRFETAAIAAAAVIAAARRRGLHG